EKLMDELAQDYNVLPQRYIKKSVLHRTDFFFSSRRRHTRLQGDWSSDVCSSDLGSSGRPSRPPGRGTGRRAKGPAGPTRSVRGRSEERRVGKECRLRWSP